MKLHSLQHLLKRKKTYVYFKQQSAYEESYSISGSKNKCTFQTHFQECKTQARPLFSCTEPATMPTWASGKAQTSEVTLFMELSFVNELSFTVIFPFHWVHEALTHPEIQHHMSMQQHRKLSVLLCLSFNANCSSRAAMWLAVKAWSYTGNITDVQMYLCVTATLPFPVTPRTSCCSI